jgi:hypothetical protein
MDERREYPFDTDALEKGSRITVEEIEKAYGVSFGTDAYQLASLKAVSYIERRFRDRGVVVTVVQRKGEVVVLTDSEAAVENARQFDLKMKGAARAHFRNMNVDRANLPPGELEVHDRNLEVEGRRRAADRAAMKALPETKPHARTTPLPPGVKAGGVKVIGEP